jgi:hypothetical protein
MAHKPLKATDKRRSKNHAAKVRTDSDNGQGDSTYDLFNDRRHANGNAKRADR